MTTRLLTLLAIAAMWLPHTSVAQPEGTFRLGVVAGQVGLLGDVGNQDSNSIGFGVTGGLYLRDDLALEANFVSSQHTDVDHNELAFGANYYLGDYTYAYPNLAAGVSFISNKIKAANLTGDGFGLYVGGGWDFELTSRITAGLQARYTLAFEGKSRVNNVDVTTVDDSVSVLLRFMYRFESPE